MTDNENLRRLALQRKPATDDYKYVHEAGHAVVAHALGFEVDGIEPTETGYRTAIEGPETPTELEHFLLAVVTLAGAAAQKKAGTPPDEGCDQDRNQAIAAILTYIGEDPHAWANGFNKEAEFLPSGFEAAYIRAGDLTVDLVKARWGEIQALASALAEFGSLSADEIRDILEPEEE